MCLSMASSNPFLGSLRTFPSSLVRFSYITYIKLDHKNFKQCKQKVDGMIYGHKLQKFITKPLAPMRFLTEIDRTKNHTNPQFLEWEQQDALVCTWILSTIYDLILRQLVDCPYSWQIWKEIHHVIYTLLTTRARQLRSELCSLTKGDLKINKFILHVHTMNESLISIGDHVPHRNRS